LPTNEKEITKEQIYEAMKCNTAEELQAYAKTQGYDITLEEANAYMAELEDVELDETVLNKVAGGYCYLQGNRDA
jgi:ribosomal protein L12E/L44/L45/RPP1/RPP2